MADEVRFRAASGGEARGELALPAGAGRVPAVLLFHEWWGVNDHIRSIARRLAEAGFAALAIDLFDGKTTKDAGEAGQLMSGLDWGRAIDQARGAVDWLAAHERTTGRVGAVGFCMGGALTFAAAAAIPHLGAAVPFYGVPADQDWARIKAPVLAHFARRDGWAKPSSAEAIQKAVVAAGGTMELHVYEADHAFVNDTRPEVHDPESARVAWDRTVAFLTDHLRH
jgi:carboxymethylenebutenolidase